MPQATPIDTASPPGDAGDTWAHAGPVVESEDAKRTRRYLHAYLDLLWVDVTLHEMLQSFPGVPETNRYSSYSFEWKQPDLRPLEDALNTAKREAEKVLGENGATDRAVLAYTTKVLELWGPLVELATYYKEQHFVDDEFARGRREAPLVADALTTLAPLRKPMSEAVFSGWREAAGDKADSPRAVLGASFEACMRVATLLFERPRANTNPDPKAEAMIDNAMGACRRGVGAVSALPAAFKAFDAPLRTAAIAFGNAVDSNYSRQYAIDDVQQLVKAYIERWPELPSEPAERPGQR